jgi:uncharacterized damage-inducible protein DinB
MEPQRLAFKSPVPTLVMEPAMSTRDAIVRLITYDRRAFEAFERGIRRRGWAEATKDRGIGHLSFKDTLVHILNVHEAWLIGAATGD